MGIKYEFYEKLPFYPGILILLLDLKSTFIVFLIIHVRGCVHMSARAWGGRRLQMHRSWSHRRLWAAQCGCLQLNPVYHLWELYVNCWTTSSALGLCSLEWNSLCGPSWLELVAASCLSLLNAEITEFPGILCSVSLSMAYALFTGMVFSQGQGLSLACCAFSTV